MSEQLEERDLQALLVLARRASSALSGPPGQSLRYRVKLSKPRAGRDRGEWVLRCYGPGLSRYGRREPSGVPFSPETRDDAEAARRSREAALNASSNLTIREVYEEWLEARIASGKLAESTIASYRKPLVWLGRNGWGDLLDGGLTAAELLRLRDLMLEGLKVKSCLWIWGRVREAWRWARRRELVVQAWPELERPRVPNLERPRKRAFTEAEVREVLEHLRGYLGGHYLPAAWLLAETGARISEVCGLKGEQLARAAEGHGVVELRTKGNRERVARISPQLANLIGEVEPDAWVFKGRRGGRLREGALRKAISLKIEAMGLKGVRDVHSLRRTAVAKLHAEGFGLEPSKQYIGHLSTEEHMRYAQAADYDLLPLAKSLWVRLGEAS